jgi:membrane protease YdiL (CAAX protease family)
MRAPEMRDDKSNESNVKFSPALLIALAVLSVATVAIGFSALSVTIYGALIFFLFKRGGRVSAREFGMPDLFVGSVFILWFAGLIARGFTAAKPHAVTQADLINGACFYTMVVAAIVFFLRMRGIKPAAQFGLLRVHPLKALPMALGLILAAFPLIDWVSRVTAHTLGPQAKQQEVVQFFLKATEASQRSAVLITLGVGVVLAPLAEELMFRGYLYGVLKRYCGVLAAAILSAAMFAAMHLNLASLPSLFVLALCFTIAYEATGSLLVNIAMHALFNLSMFLMMLYLPQPPPLPQ